MPIAEKNREFQQIREAALSQQWEVTRTSKGHWKFKPPQGEQTVTAGGTYKDPRAIKNLVARLRQLGFKAPQRGGK